MILRFVASIALSSLLAVQTTPLWKDPTELLLLGVERIAQSDFREAIPILEASVAADPKAVLSRAWLANAYHLQRRLDEAGAQYKKLLELEPVQPLSDTQRQAVVRFAPRVFQVASDPFGLL